MYAASQEARTVLFKLHYAIKLTCYDKENKVIDRIIMIYKKGYMKMLRLYQRVFLVSLLSLFVASIELCHAMEGEEELSEDVNKSPPHKRKVSEKNGHSESIDVSALGESKYDKKRDMYFYGTNLSKVKAPQKALQPVKKDRNLVLFILEEEEPKQKKVKKSASLTTQEKNGSKLTKPITKRKTQLKKKNKNSENSTQVKKSISNHKK